MGREALPRSGSDTTVLLGHLNKLAVWKVLVLFGSFDDRFDERDIAARLKRVGADVPDDQIRPLYYLAIEEAAKASKGK
jgi:hypothetical protein